MLVTVALCYLFILVGTKFTLRFDHYYYYGYYYYYHYLVEQES
jgi:hypothetical protein